MALGVGLALAGATGASAIPTGHWGDFTVSGTGKAYTGTMSMPGFPVTTFRSNASQATVISGASTWQSAATGPGQRYGTSKGNTYINQRPNANNAGSPSVTTYTFDGPTPAGSWSFVLGDIDADQATISATVQGGAPATADQLGFQSSYNSCSAAVAGGWSCTPDPDGMTGRDVPTWSPGDLQGTLTGNAAAADTAGATAWFTPTVALESLTISYQWRSGFPVYQTWFASRTAAIAGTATLDGTPIPGSTVTVTAPRGTVYTTTTAADGTYAFPDLPVIGGYQVAITPPSGANGDATRTGVPLLVNGAPSDQTVDFAFTAPQGSTSVIGTVTDETGAPVADVPVVITDPASPGAPPLETSTNSVGVYIASGLPPETDLQVAVDGGTPTPITTGAAGQEPVQVAPIQAPADSVSTVSGSVTLDGAPAADVVVELVDRSGTVVATATTTAAGAYAFSALPGAYTVRSALPADGAQGTATQAVDTTAGDASADFRFTTPSPAVPEVVAQPGTVTDADGAPAAGVTVVATPTGPDSGDAVTTTTDADGAFTLDGLQPTTEYSIVAGTGDTASEPVVLTTVDVGEAPTPLAVTLQAAPTVEQPGTVIDAAGAPAADVEVVATPTDPTTGTAVTTSTDADGAFDLVGLAPSTQYSIVAGSGATASAPQVVTTAAVGATPAPLTFALTAAVVSPSPTPGPTTGPTPGPVPVAGGDGDSPSGPLAFTGAELTPAAIAAGILVLLGGGLLTFRAARNRRRTEHLQD
ncbi:hypothetical protein BIU90_08415 [Curtobacterium sp. MCBA15_001]|nr:hypothetical protein BIU90_08415 [Curtobacterium sp. MCBA15_001]